MNSSIDQELKNLRDEISLLEDFQQLEILKIINKNNIKYTTNNNGIFINMKVLEPSCLNDIYNFLNFIKNKN
jgi:hypothetical protein